MDSAAVLIQVLGLWSMCMATYMPKVEALIQTRLKLCRLHHDQAGCVCVCVCVKSCIYIPLYAARRAMTAVPLLR